jgi:hypothetical protein
MVLHARVCGSVGSCPVYHKAQPKGWAFVFSDYKLLAHHNEVGYYLPMRSDMSKVIVERPRRGSHLRSVKFGARVSPRGDLEDFDLAPPRDRDQKSLNENLAPLRRYLDKQIGRPWDKVYSEIRANLDTRKATQLHILQHLDGYVETRCWMDGKTVMGSPHWFRPRPVEGLYVHPKTGILRRAPKRTLDREREPVTHVRLSDLARYELIDGVWFRFDYRKRDPDEVLEVVRFHEEQPERNMKYGLRREGDRRIVRYRDAPTEGRPVFVSKRQCTLAEVEAAMAAAGR